MSLTQNEVPPALCLAGNPMWLDYTTSDTHEDFIGIHFKVFEFRDGEYQQIGGEIRIEPDEDGKAIIDIHTLVEWDPVKEFTWKENPSSLIHRRVDLRKIYDVTIYEKYGNPLTIEDEESLGALRALPGKISDLKQGLLNDQSTTWMSRMQSEKRFLTNSPRTKTTDAWASERLFYYLFPGVPDTITLRIKIFYTDGTDTTFTRETNSPAAYYYVYEIITSFSTLGIYFIDPTKTIEKYEVWLEDQTTAVISEVFTYLVDHTPHDDSKYFLFANGYKMIEGARFTGESKSSSKVDQLNLKRFMGIGYGSKDRSEVKEMVSETEYREASSEWLSIDEINWIREMALSKEVYEIVNGETVPILIDGDSITFHESDDNLRSFNIKYRYAHSDSVPAIVPDVVDSMSNFQGSNIDFGGLTNGGAGQQFATMSYNDSTGEFTLETQDTDHPLAYSDALDLPLIPLLACYWNLSQISDFCDLVMLLMDNALDGQTSPTVVPLVWNESTGFGILITSQSNDRFCVRGANLGSNNTHEGNLLLYIPTKRCLEFLYELGL